MSQPAADKPLRLTEFSHGAGCGCKLPAADLHKVLSSLPGPTDPKLMVSASSGDDAAVYDLGDNRYLIETLDFFTPVVDDPRTFGQIAAANAISDVYAMGATPIFGLNIVAFPSKTLDLSVLQEILLGGTEKAKEAGFFVAGGHSIDDAEPKYGMVVTGIVEKDKLLTNSNAKVGNVLVLTKPIGVGIMTTAVKKQLATEADIAPAIRSMASLNRPGAMACNKVGANAATDITGFGLFGHLSRMATESGVSIELRYDDIPFFEQAQDFVRKSVAPGGTKKNLAYYGKNVHFAREFKEWQQLIMADAQTSGGMVIAVDADKADALIEELKNQNALASAIIGEVKASGEKPITVV